MKTIKFDKDRILQSGAFKLIFPVVAVLLSGVYPVFYFYRKNVTLVPVDSFGRILLAYLALILLAYGIALVFTRFKAVKAANAASVFLVFFNSYGMLFTLLKDRDIVMVKHYWMLPLYLLISVYAAWLVTRLKRRNSRSLWRGITLVFLVLLVLSIISIIPAEVTKASVNDAHKLVLAAEENTGGAKPPDIYYLIYDEFSGFKAMREYWHTEEVDPFKQWLLDKGFFVAEDSVSSGTSTLHQMTSRLNFTDYPDIPDQEQTYFKLIANNKVMALLKSKGYTTVMFDEISWQYPTMPEINVDVYYGIDPSDQSDFGMLFDDFGVLITNNTMVYAFSDYYQLEDFGYRPHRNMILSTVERLGNMDDIPQPRFVYSHLMIPHRPYLFTADGEMLDSEFYRDWNYYEGYWVYSLGVIKEMVKNILADADPANPPVIILQSDHGARLHRDDYPFQGHTPILFAMYLPGYAGPEIPQDVNPVNTFPIVFNENLGEEIPLQ